MPEIPSDKDLPKPLNTPTKQTKRLKQLLLTHLGTAVSRVHRPPMQGMFSRTFFADLSDGREVVVQFRTEALDLDTFRVARGALGESFVPDIVALTDEELEVEGAWAYSITRLPGKMWLHGVAGKGAAGRVAVNKSLGRVFGRGWLAEGSAAAVEEKVRPHLEAVLASGLEEIGPYRTLLEGFAGRLGEFGTLPLWVAHYDLNEVNVLIDEDCVVTGLIDWELSAPRPFGVGFGRVHTIAGEYTGGEFWMPDEFEEAERAFWGEMFAGMPPKVRAALEEKMDLVQDAVILGTLLDAFFFENGKVGCGPVTMKALPKFVTYRLPFVRGEDPPYKE